MTRLAYRLLLNLYPPSFRHRFAAEMLEIFDAVSSAGAPAAAIASMLIDAMWSVARQWALREKLWIYAGALFGALLTTSAVHLADPRPSLARVMPSASTPEIFLVLAMGSMLAIALTMIFSVVWFRKTQAGRKRRA